MDFKKLAEEYMPTKVSRITSILLLPVATGGYYVVDSVRPLFNFWRDDTFAIFKVTVFLLLLLIGSLIIIVSLAHHIKTRNLTVTVSMVPGAGDTNTDQGTELSEEAYSILAYCLENDKTSFISETIIDALSHSRIGIESAFEELEGKDLIRLANHTLTGARYVLTKSGKKRVLNLNN